MVKSDNLNIQNKNGVTFVTFPNIEKTGFVNHCFSTKFGGVSRGKYATMNFGFQNGDDRDAVLENYRRICSAIGADYKKCVVSKQTHTTNIKIVKAKDAGMGVMNERDYTDIDGLITDVPDIVLVTQYADCVPLLFADPEKRVIASSHAGWRGTVHGIGKKTVEIMVREFGCDPKNIQVGIGPSIMQCCFEVDKPVYDEFLKLENIDINDICKVMPNNKYNINLQKTNSLLIQSAGVPKENIVITDLCTKCHPDVFHSHRAKNGERGNMAAFISIKQM